MAEDTDHKKEPSPLSEDEVEALSEKFTASWEGSDSTHAGPKRSDDAALPEGPGGRSRLKRTMLGMPQAPPDPPVPHERPNDPALENGDVIDEDALPRQKTLLGLQAPDPMLVKQIAESFVSTGSATPASAPAPDSAANVPVSEVLPPLPLVQVAPDADYEPGADHEPVADHEPGADDAPTSAASMLAVDVEWPDEATPAPTSPPPAPAPPTAEMAAAPVIAVAPPLSSTAPLAPSPGPIPQGPGLFGWGAAATPSPRMVTARMGSMAETAPAAAQPAQAEPAAVMTGTQPAEDKLGATQHAVFPEESTLPTGMAPGKSPPASPVPPVQTYAPPIAPPPPLGSAPTNEKTIVIEDDSAKSPEDEARALAMRMAQRADTLPPQRPRLEIELPPELQRSRKTGLWIVGALSLLIAAGAVFALGGDADVPALSAEKSAEVNAVTPEPTPAPEKPAATEPASDEAAPGATAAGADAAESATEPEPAAVTPKPAPAFAAKPKPATTIAKRPTTTSKPAATPPSKTSKVKKTAKPASKTIVRDAPF